MVLGHYMCVTFVSFDESGTILMKQMRNLIINIKAPEATRSNLRGPTFKQFPGEHAPRPYSHHALHIEI